MSRIKGSPKTGGRKVGSKNKPPAVSLDDRRLIVIIAKELTPKMLNVLAEIAEDGISETARITAATAIIERGWGKVPEAQQPVQPNTSYQLIEAFRMPQEAPATAAIAIDSLTLEDDPGAPRQ